MSQFVVLSEGVLDMPRISLNFDIVAIQMKNVS